MILMRASTRGNGWARLREGFACADRFEGLETAWCWTSGYPKDRWVPQMGPGGQCGLSES